MLVSKTTRFCGQCGASLIGDERFCGECGTACSLSTTSLPTCQPKVVVGSPSQPNATIHGDIPQSGFPKSSAAPSLATGSSRRSYRSLGAILLLSIAAIATLGWFLPGWLFVPWEGAAQAKLIYPGETNLSEVVEVLGQYDRIGAYGESLEYATFWPNRNSIAEATVWLDSNRTVRCLRITPSQPIPEKRFRKSFDIMERSLAMSRGNLMAHGSEPSGDTYHLASGRYIYVVGKEVLEYWHVDLKKNNVTVDSILREIHNENYQQLDEWSGTQKSVN